MKGFITSSLLFVLGFAVPLGIAIHWANGVEAEAEANVIHMEPVIITVEVTRYEFEPEVVTAKRPQLTLVGCTEFECSYEYR
ncbi:MAG: hypothetical protein CME17_01135 [Gemmatimonadetes bacterium]|nr:hypothetical protein [Gemmatimonadota bacterium]